MDHGLMDGMLAAGILMSAIPLAVGITIGVLVFRRYRAQRAEDAARKGA